MDKSGDITIFRGKIFVSQYRNFSLWTLLCFKKNSSIENSSIENRCQRNHKNIWHDLDSNPDLPLQNPVILPTVPWEPLEWKEWNF